MTEATEQMRVVEWCRQTDWKRRQAGLPPLGMELVIHIPNGGWRSRSEAAKLKAMGVRAGVSDLLIPVAMNGRHGLWVEMKCIGVGVNGGRVGVAQKEWIDLMRAQGYCAEVAAGFDQAVKIIKQYFAVDVDKLN